MRASLRLAIAALALLGLTPIRPIPPIPKPLPIPPAHGYVAVDNVKLFYAQYGKTGVPVVLLEGGGDTIDDFAYLVPALSRHYRVIALDARCQGRSTCSSATLSYERDLHDVIAVIDHLHIRKAAFVGFSDGAIVGLELAIYYPQRVIGVFAHAANTSPAAAITAPDPANAPAEHALDRVSRDWYAAESPTPSNYDAMQKRLEALWSTQPHLTATQLHSIHVPVWVTDGDHEEYIKRSDTDFMARSIPTAAELIFPNAGHYAPWSQHELFNEAVLEFLRQIS